ncbi:DUF7529 family protein [Halorarius halobius]|uniref:DUF7529 family protein n=1 Tax=Halorarius halobius TaxID=2962671 RepID=UPI0020CBF18E|nr:hypothetical protein [Halorarius halobius]
MVETGDEEVDYAERIAANADVLKNAWEETIEDMKAMAADMEEDGWDAFYVAAGDTAPEHPEAGDPDRWGLVHVIPDNYVDGFEEAFETGEFPEYDVFRQEASGELFGVTLLTDPDSRTAILIAWNLRLHDATPLVNKARSEEAMYSHVQTLDGTVHGSFEHDAPEKFFPRFEEYEAYFSADYDALADDDA